MRYMEKETMDTFAVSLTLEAHERAKDLARQQPTRYKAKQVYLNTLAVYAGRCYLQCCGLETGWEDCDSSNPIRQLLMDVADLEVKNLGGRLEFRPVLPDSEFVHIPSDVWDDRMGYVAVQLDQSLRQATLLGFTKTVSQEEVPLSELHSLEDLLDELHVNVQVDDQADAQPINLSAWLYKELKEGKKLVEQGWQSLEELYEILNPQEPAFVYRFGAAAALRGRNRSATLSSSTGIPTLIDLLHNNSNKSVRFRAIELLGDVGKGNKEAIAALTELMEKVDKNDYETRREAQVCLGKIDPLHPQAGLKKAKIFDLGMELDGHEVAVVITLAPKSKDTIQVHLRVYPIKTSNLPSDLCLTLLDEKGTTLNERRSRQHDQYMQLTPFIVDSGTVFEVKLALNEAKFVHQFVV